MKNRRKKIIWLTWETQIRNRSLSKLLGIQLYEILSNNARIKRYVYCVFQSIRILIYEKPSVVVCQNPSLVLTIVMLSLRYILHFKVVVDAHFGGVTAYNGSNIFQMILDTCNKVADMVIVTNENHANYLGKRGGKTFIIQDPLPDVSRYMGSDEENKKVYFICSFDIDEPFIEVFKAAEILSPEGYRFFVTGNFKKAGIDTEEYPFVKFLGYIPTHDYYHQLFTSELVIDLTEHDNCLVCGAYEAIAARKVIILSKKKGIIDYFTSGVVLTENNSSDIVTSIRYGYSHKSRLLNKLDEWKALEKEKMERKINILKQILIKM